MTSYTIDKTVWLCIIYIYHYHLIISDISNCYLFSGNCTGVTIGIEPPGNPNGTEGMNSSIEYCVVITLHDLATPNERGGFSVCVSTVDGTATGKNNSFSSTKYDSFSYVMYVGYYCSWSGLPCSVQHVPGTI